MRKTANALRKRAYTMFNVAHALADPFIHEAGLRDIRSAERLERQEKGGQE